MPGTKIKDLKGLARAIAGLKKKGKRIVFTNGCFDILHYGHVMYLAKARKKGDCLVVGVNSDASVRRIKGKNRPLVHEQDRARVVAALSSVDHVVLFGEDTPLMVIKAIRPDVLVKGSDWSRNDIVGGDLVKSYGGSVQTIKLASGRSTSNLIKRILEVFRAK